MCPAFGDAPGRHNRSDTLADVIQAACERAGHRVGAFSDRDYTELPAFNWDVTDHEECAALHLIDHAVNILHVASVYEDGAMVYRAKTLFLAPAAILLVADRFESFRGFARSPSASQEKGQRLWTIRAAS